MRLASGQPVSNASGPVEYPLTPDGRYMVVRGRLWRVANPHLPRAVRDELVRALMDARRQVKTAIAADNEERLARARRSVDAAKTALGERGALWWDDGSKDFNRHLVKNTPYREWYERLVGPQS